MHVRTQPNETLLILNGLRVSTSTTASTDSHFVYACGVWFGALVNPDELRYLVTAFNISIITSVDRAMDGGWGSSKISQSIPLKRSSWTKHCDWCVCKYSVPRYNPYYTVTPSPPAPECCVSTTGTLMLEKDAHRCRLAPCAERSHLATPIQKQSV